MPKLRAPVHPGEILKTEFMDPLRITPYKLAKDLGVDHMRIRRILAGERSITADTAIRLGQYFNTTPQFWLNLQSGYDLRCAKLEKKIPEIKMHPEIEENATASKT